MGRHQRAETTGLVSFFLCACIGAVSMIVYLNTAPAFWQLMQRRFMFSAGTVAACAVISFCVGYIGRSHSFTLKRGWLNPLRRLFETLALSAVYAATVFLSVFALLNAVNNMMGSDIFIHYLPAVCAGCAGVVGYMTFVQAQMMNAKTLAALLPFFVVSGVCTAGLTTEDPNWYHNNFSQLGDSTTFAATMFNATLIMCGICVIIVSYFSVSELVTTERLRRIQLDHSRNDPNHGFEISHFMLRMAILSILLTLAGLAFMGIGMFRYTPHKIVHNMFAKSLPVIMAMLFLSLPWLAPRLSKAMMAISDIGGLICALFWMNMMSGNDTLTNVEALAGFMFLGWFIVFSRQIAAIESDRVQTQLAMVQTHNNIPNADVSDGGETILESRLASDR